MKHDEKTRQGVYIDELKKNVKQFFRSKLFKSHFPYHSKNPESGWITAYETTLSKTGGYHIHTHILLCGNPIKIPVNKLQKQISANWKKITKDSFVVDLQLIKIKDVNPDTGKEEIISNGKQGVYKTVRELVKYGTKAGKIRDWDFDKADLYSDWILSTRGKNFINCSGLFRKLQLTGMKSRYDDKPNYGELFLKENEKILIGKMSQLRFNKYTIQKEKHEHEILKKVRIKTAVDFENITDSWGEFLKAFDRNLQEDEIHYFLNKWIAEEKENLKQEFDYRPSEDERKRQIKKLLEMQKKIDRGNENFKI